MRARNWHMDLKIFMAVFRTLFFSFAMLISATSFAADKMVALELVFVTSDYCPFCKAWERDVGPAYNQSPYGHKAPLRRIDIADVQKKLPNLSPRVNGTPVFLILSEDREIGRIQGYQSRDMFYWALSEYIQP